MLIYITKEVNLISTLRQRGCQFGCKDYIIDAIMSHSGPNLDKFRMEKCDLSMRSFEVFLCDLDQLRRCGGLEHDPQAASLVYHYPHTMPEKYRQSRFRQLTSTFKTHQDLFVKSAAGPDLFVMNDGSCCKIHHQQDHVLFVNLLNNKKDNSEKVIICQEDENLVTNLMRNIEACVGLFNGGFTQWRDRLPAEGGIFREQVTTFFNQYLWLNNIFKLTEGTLFKPNDIIISSKTPTVNSSKMKKKGNQRLSKVLMKNFLSISTFLSSEVNILLDC